MIWEAPASLLEIDAGLGAGFANPKPPILLSFICFPKNPPILEFMDSENRQFSMQLLAPLFREDLEAILCCLGLAPTGCSISSSSPYALDLAFFGWPGRWVTNYELDAGQFSGFRNLLGAASAAWGGIDSPDPES